MTETNKIMYSTTGNRLLSIGLTKRELFAAMAMQGILASESAVDASASAIAADAVAAADALIKALNNTP